MTKMLCSIEIIKREVINPNIKRIYDLLEFYNCKTLLYFHYQYINRIFSHIFSNNNISTKKDKQINIFIKSKDKKTSKKNGN